MCWKHVYKLASDLECLLADAAATAGNHSKPDAGMCAFCLHGSFGFTPDVCSWAVSLSNTCLVSTA